MQPILTTATTSPRMRRIIEAVRALGPYAQEGGDKDQDRAATYPCNRTDIDVGTGSIIIYSGPYGAIDGYFEPARPKSSTVPLDGRTMNTILRLLDDGGFPTYDS